MGTFANFSRPDTQVLNSPWRPCHCAHPLEGTQCHFSGIYPENNYDILNTSAPLGGCDLPCRLSGTSCFSEAGWVPSTQPDGGWSRSPPVCSVEWLSRGWSRGNPWPSGRTSHLRTHQCSLGQGCRGPVIWPFARSGSWLYVCLHAKPLHLCPTLCNSVDYSLPGSPVCGILHGGLTCPPPEDLPNPGIEPRSPALQADSLLSEPPGKPAWLYEPLPVSE